MKAKLLTLALLLMGVSAGAQQKITVYQDCARNGAPDNQTGQAPANVEMVDLGLSVKWANMNVGATAPEEYGLYFAWGETQGYTSDTNDGRSFDEASYKWCNGSFTQMTKYCTYSEYGYNGFMDNKTTLEPADDAATANWGGTWRMPTRDELDELRTNCTWTWTTQNGVNGYRVTATNGNSIFLPAAGARYDTNLIEVGSYGDYWSSSLAMYYSYDVYFDSSDLRSYFNYRIYGLSVRPVCPSLTLTSTPYTITFVNYDGTTLQSDNVEEGSMPSYRGITPTKPADTGYSYEFAGWSPSVVAATEPATYTATFRAAPTTSGSAPANVEMVDLGLSVKWANMNVGATAPEGYGLYFAWGETQGYMSDTHDGRSFDWASYKWCNGSLSDMTKYCTEGRYGYNGFADNKTTLEPADDAATANWGGDWRMPTDDEWDELYARCAWTWTTQNGVIGYRVTASNGNSIFLPAAGYRYDTNLLDVRSDGYYWSSSIDTYKSFSAFFGYFHSSDVRRHYCSRNYGQSVRPVCPSSTYTITFVNYDGTTLQSDNVKEGSIPSYRGITPTKPADTGYSYEFAGWSPSVVAATESATYTATFTATLTISGSAPANVEMVDLGLSVKWANMNVGATAPEESGDYFAWGETQGYTSDTNDGRSFGWASYKWCNGTEMNMTKYCTQSEYGHNGFMDNKTTLEPADDAATANWGGDWRMPTDDEWDELYARCAWTWTTQNGVIGYRVTASNGNSIFLPAAGARYDTNLDNVGSGGYYWSSSLSMYYSYWSYDVKFNSSYVNRYINGRCCGLSVRPVCP